MEEGSLTYTGNFPKFRTKNVIEASHKNSNKSGAYLAHFIFGNNNNMLPVGALIMKMVFAFENLEKLNRMIKMKC